MDFRVARVYFVLAYLLAGSGAWIVVVVSVASFVVWVDASHLIVPKTANVDASRRQHLRNYYMFVAQAQVDPVQTPVHLLIRLALEFYENVVIQLYTTQSVQYITR